MILIREKDKNWNTYSDHCDIKGNGRTIPNDVWQIDATPFFGHESFYSGINARVVKFDVDLSSDGDFLNFCKLLNSHCLRINKYTFSQDYEDASLWFCFDSNSIVYLEGQEKSILNRMGEDGLCESELKKLYFLFDQGFIVKSTYDEVTKYSLYRSGSMLSNQDVDSYMILPTLQCNARCFYCFENNDQKNNMSAETMQQVGKFIVNRSRRKKAVLRWFGGEPLLRCDVIDWISESLADNEIDFSSIITTNGSLITDQIISKMISTWHTKKVHLTLDGDEKEHNKRKNYRDSSINGYQLTIDNIDKLLNSNCFVVCRLNLDKNNISCLDDILRQLSVYKDNPHFFVHATTIYLPKYSSFSGSFTREEYEDTYSMLFEKMIKFGFTKGPQFVLPEKVVFRCTACMNNHLVIDPQGGLYKCEQEEKIPEHQVGNVWEGICYTEHLGYWLDGQLSTECNNCQYLPICQGGCKWRASIDNPDLTPCVNTRYQMNAIGRYIRDSIVRQTL